MFDPIYNFFGSILAFFYGVVANLGISIILLTIAVMLALFPLTAKQAKAMLSMQRAQPELKKIQAKYKNDRQKMNEEVMKFYQENKINPLAGCLPLLVQMPVFFALFHVMRNPFQNIPKTSELYGAFCTDKFGEVVSQAQCAKSPLPNHLKFLGMDLSQHATGVAGGFLDALPYFALVGIVIGTGVLQARQSQRNAPNMNAQMAMVTKLLPILFGLFSLQFPAGLVLYFFVSNLWRLGQQELIMRKITRPGLAANAAAGATIDVQSSEAPTATAERKPSAGLRKRFQSSDPTAATGAIERNGATGADPVPDPKGPSAASRSARGSQARRTSSTPGGQRRKNSKRRKKR